MIWSVHYTSNSDLLSLEIILFIWMNRQGSCSKHIALLWFYSSYESTEHKTRWRKGEFGHISCAIVLFVFVGWFVLLVLLPSALVVAFEFCSGVFFFFFLSKLAFGGYTHSLLLLLLTFLHTLDGKSSTGYACFFVFCFFWLLLVWLHMKNQALVNTCSGSC